MFFPAISKAVPCPVEVLISGTSDLNSVSVVRIYANDGYLGFMEEQLANNYYTYDYTPVESGTISIHVEVEFADGSILESDVEDYNVSGSGGVLEV